MSTLNVQKLMNAKIKDHRHEGSLACLENGIILHSDIVTAVVKCTQYEFLQTGQPAAADQERKQRSPSRRSKYVDSPSNLQLFSTSRRKTALASSVSRAHNPAHSPVKVPLCFVSLEN
ncbi:hypothetical protein F2P81_019605 [Scophthalmus maximus]|uniref:Uncharacterized protein n=1 Tax=Scophthalmus maximus TaxID=52904 RepID=A0A6A4S8H9_SCOMX|nr:hypothetical protein F2P81_019605 [Scophthalmus maximus]